MGNGIAHVFARMGGYEVVLVDVEQRFLDRGVETIRKNLEREVTKEKITAEACDAAVARITPTVDRLCGWRRATSWLRRRVSGLRLSRSSFRDLDQLCLPGSDLGIDTLVDLDYEAGRGDQASGENGIPMHFFNPVPMMKLVEVIRGLATSDETYATVKAAGRKAGEDAGRGE